MHPAATRENSTPTPAAYRPALVVAEAIRWIMPATHDAYGWVHAWVGDAFQAWGVPEAPADLLGELAADYADDVMQLAPPYVAVTAMIEGTRATVSVIPAHAPEPVHRVQLAPYPVPYSSPVCDCIVLAPGPCLRAAVSLLGRG